MSMSANRKGKKKARRGQALLNRIHGSSGRRYEDGGALPALGIATGSRGRGLLRRSGNAYANSPPKRSAKARIANMHKKWLQHTTQMTTSGLHRDERDVAASTNTMQPDRGRGRGRGGGEISEIRRNGSAERDINNGSIGNTGLLSVRTGPGPRSQSSIKDGEKEPR